MRSSTAALLSLVCATVAQAGEPRAGSSLSLTRGLHRLESAEAMRPFELAIGVSADYFTASDFLAKGASNTYHAEHVLLALSLFPGLELGGSWSMKSNTNDGFAPKAIESRGDPSTTLKYTFAMSDELRLGAVVHGLFPTSPQGTGIKGSALSFGGAALASYHVSPAMQLVGNVGYKLDRSGQLFKRELTRAQQFAASVSKVDVLTYGVGAGGLFGVSEAFALGGFLELAGELASSVGFAGSPLRASAGLRSLMLEDDRLEIVVGADLRLAGAPPDGRELPGVPPWQAFARLVARLEPLGGREAPPPPPPPPVVIAEPEPPPPEPVPEPPKLFEVAGLVLDKASGAALVGAKVTFSGIAEPVTTGEGGAFKSSPMEVSDGLMQLKVEAPGYHPGEHTMARGPANGVAEVKLELVAVGKHTPGVLRGSIKDARTGDVIAGTVTIPSIKRKLEVGKDGSFSTELTAGRYEVIISSPKLQPQTKVIEIRAGDVVILNIDMSPRR